LFLKREHHRIELTESKLSSASPDRILRLGFSIARINGKAIRSAENIKEGDEIETTLASGIIKSTVTWKKQ
jgi:exodeoxyribonuclease VII large subunit